MEDENRQDRKKKHFIAARVAVACILVVGCAVTGICAAQRKGTGNGNVLHEEGKNAEFSSSNTAVARVQEADGALKEQDAKNQGAEKQEMNKQDAEKQGEEKTEIEKQETEKQETEKQDRGDAADKKFENGGNGLQDSKAAEEEEKKIIETYLARMTLHEKICQMMLMSPEALTGVGNATAAGDVTRLALEENPIGGIILFDNNLESVDQTTEMIANYQKYAANINGIGMFVAVDEEGGRVDRVAEKLGTTKLNPMFQYRMEGEAAAYRNAATIAKDIATFGFNLDFAPVADTWSNPENTVIGERAYSDDFAETAKLVAAAVEGFHSEHMMCTLKHFPGHGDTAQDSHRGSAYSYKSLEELRTQEFLAFEAGMEKGADMVMVAHIILPELDALPASLSHVAVTDLLRGELGYEGVVITDSLLMKALSEVYGYDEMAVMAVNAGDDILLGQEGLTEMVNAIESAVSDGEISEERIDESVRRILGLKYRYGLLATEGEE